MNIYIDDTFRLELPADKVLQNHRRQVFDACFSYVTPQKTTNPTLIHYADEMLSLLGLTTKDATSEAFLQVFTGNKILADTHPYAMCYGGHQFGQWAGQLGDGRAINLFEVFYNNKRWALQLKGAGETPYARTADGLAVLRSSIREYLCSEAMHHLGIPTTRALSLSLTGEKVLRDMLYNGNPAYEKGAVVCRVAQSFIRFGNFEILSARKNNIVLKQLADYTIKHFFKNISSKGTQKYIDFFKQVRNKTIAMIVHWQRVGFVHGVMNTDNMSILGLTIDYGPYGWLDNYDYHWTPNTTDAQHKRYRYGNQPYIGMWNITKLANALYPLIEDVAVLQNLLNEYESLYLEQYRQMMLQKLGLFSLHIPTAIIEDLERVLQLIEIDYTIFFRLLATVSKKDTSLKAIDKIISAFYQPEALQGTILTHWTAWFDTYLTLLQHETTPQEVRKEKMNLVNPKYIFRNYMAQLAIEEAEKGNYNLIDEMYQLLKNPYQEQSQYEKWFAKRPEYARHKVGCSMLSCSS